MTRKTQLLPQISFTILLALSLRERHGYEILQQVEEDSGGRLRLGAGALYTSIHKLKQAGYIEETDGDGKARRKYYRLTPDGFARFEQEAGYYQEIAQVSQGRLRLTGEEN